ncbi:hypothetical protein OFW50_08815 [Lacticaseibacillus chiayiensis]|uniref:Dihydroneopterin aldolase/epimerase domain-containing protein n=1 Tax=Lacticaseibacillus chiayiensis TaxID=2100821 RepID=A0ABY6HBN3_9LACO|nr:dihydroneopterin aldolase [Lacticaseibacillus chiayiensis]UYN57847.1 hypothetical protein OFW50_08815 [Lacticaseibacillus chiayiensis]
MRLKLQDLNVLKADALTNTISYGEVYKIIAHEVALSQDQLLEYLGVRIVEALRDRFAEKFSSLTLSIKKIALPINGTNALVKIFLLTVPNRKVTGWVGFLGDKQVVRCVDRLLDLPNAEFVVSTPDNPERALPADKLYGIFQANQKIKQNHVLYKIPDPSSLFNGILANPDAEMIYIATGSFYFINQVKSQWEQYRFK